MHLMPECPRILRPCRAFGILLATLTSAVSLAGNGIINGKVIDAETGEPLPLANVIIVGTELGAATDLDGMYSITLVPPGTHTVLASTLGYAESEVTDVKTESDCATRLVLPLTPRAIAVRTVSVTAGRARSTVAGLLSSRRTSPTISTGISAEQISRTPDSRASDVLKRATGLSVVEDRFVYVRGLSERYSNATLNKCALPSPEPDKRVVPFDIFPSELLDDVVISKTFAPNLSGEFAGGAIQLTTKEFPEQPIGRFSMSTGYNTGTTFRGFDTYQGGAIDFLGFDDGTRGLPRNVREATRSQPLVERGGHTSYGFTEEELERFGESFANVWTPVRGIALPNQSYGLSFGNQTEIKGRPVGYLAALTYRNSRSFREQESTFYYVMGAGDTLEKRHEIDTLRTSRFNVLAGGVLNASYKPTPRDKYGIKTTFTRSADDEVVVYYILPNRDHNLDEKGYRLRWIERSLLSSGVSGEHQLSNSGNRLEWRGNYSLATREEPDTREILYESEIGQNHFRLADESNSGSRFFSSLIDHTADAAVDWTLAFKQWSSLPSKLALGGSFTYRNRTIDNRRFRFKPQDGHNVNVYGTPEDIFSPGNIRPDGFEIEEDTRPTDNYNGTQDLGAAYAMVDMPVVRRLRLVAGARVEYSNQNVRTFELFNPGAPPLTAVVQNIDILPSVNLTHKLSEEMNLRGAFSQTVSRPSFRELTPFEFTDVGGYATVGDTGLKRALIQNYDLGWEWYPSPDEHLAVSIFYKRFTSPIEVGLENATEITRTWRNAISAYNWRVEIEAGFELQRLVPSLKGLRLGGNLAFIESRVQLDTSKASPETNKQRPLQGQSPYVVNLSLEYLNTSIGFRTGILFNVSGRRITAVGKCRTPDYYEESLPELDATISKQFLGKLNIKLNASNLLDPKARFTQGSRPQKVYRKGRSFSLGLSYSL